MHPSRVAKITATIGAALLLAAAALRLLSIGYTISILGLLHAPAEPELPLTGMYQVAPGGEEIRFTQGVIGDPTAGAAWYSMAAEGGPIFPVDGPVAVEIAPFRLSDGVVYIQGAAANSLTRVSPAREQVTQAALAPDGQALAFITSIDGGRARLYIMHRDGVLEWLGEEPAYSAPNWSPDAGYLAFIVPVDGFPQVFQARADGQDYLQLTADPTQKDLPRWSPDGRLIAYLALTLPEPAVTDDQPDPTPEKVEVFTIEPGGQNPRKLAEITPNPAVVQVLEDGQQALPPSPYMLDWIGSSAAYELAYAAAPFADAPSTAYLYAAAPASGAIRRIYPPVMIDALDCPSAFSVGSPAAASLTITNSARVPVDLPLSMREQPLPFDFGSATGKAVGDLIERAGQRISELLRREPPRQRPAAGELSPATAERLETLTLLPGETHRIDWPVTAQSGARRTFLTASTGQEHPFPIRAQSCSAPNTFYGLPNLPFLSLTLPLIVLGMLACVPRLLQQKNGRWWAYWAALPFLFFMFFLFEANLNVGG